MFKGANETGRAAPSQATLTHTSTQQQKFDMPCTSAQAAERERRHEGQTSVAPAVVVDRRRLDIADKIREKRTHAEEKRQHVERLHTLDQAALSHEDTAAFLDDSREVQPGDQHHKQKGVRLIKIIF